MTEANHEPTAGAASDVPAAELKPITVFTEIEDIFARAVDGMPIYERLGKLAGVAEKIGTDLTNGFPSAQVEQRRAEHGKNQLPEERLLTFWEILLNAWSDHMIILLAIAALIAIILGLTTPHPGEEYVDRKTGWIEGFAIIVSITLVTTVSSVNDYTKEQKFAKLTRDASKQPTKVIRDGQIVTIDVSEVVVGDLMQIAPGLVMPVDGFFVTGMSVVIDESSVTGENDPKKKSIDQPFYLAGTIVNTAENAVVLVGAVGVRSFGGKLLMETRNDEGEIRATPLQNRLDDMAEQIGKLGLSAAILLFIALSIVEIVRFARKDPKADGKNWLSYFLLCVAIVVVAVPEGLPLAVTVALAYSQNNMRKDNNQVRRLKACEIMGNATQICSDKTGTLTQNKMSVVQCCIGNKNLKVTKPGDYAEAISFAECNPATLKLFLDSAAFNSSSEKRRVGDKWKWELDKGNKTDDALLDFVDRLQLEQATNEHLPHQLSRAKLVPGSFCVYPFTSDRKRMSVVVKIDGVTYFFVKGGADQIVPLCTEIVDENGKEVALTAEGRDAVEKRIKDYASCAYRNIGFAYKILPSDFFIDMENEPDVPLVWLGVVGIQDPLRPEVKEAVRKCKNAGVKVRMCTGDNIDTAIAISKECGIFANSSGDLAMTGLEFRNLVYDCYGDEERMKEFNSILNKMTVMARSQPLDKQLLVLMLMLKGEVVAVTGDGTNDAPALKLANVGFCMRSGTDIAVKSADIVLLDDNFKSVQRAVVWGRTVNDNIRKFLQLQLTINVSSVLLTFIGSLAADNSSPLTTVQLLWLNLVMDSFAAIALATEQPSEQCLSRGPIHRQASLVSRRMMVTILLPAIWTLIATLVLLQVGHDWFGVEPAITKGELITRYNVEHLTIIFNIFVMASLFQMFNARKLYEELNIFEGLISRSKPFCVIILICFGFQAIAVQLFRDFIQTRPLRWNQWLGCIAASVPVLPIVFFSRFIPITEPDYSDEFDNEELDDEAKKMMAKVTKLVDENAVKRAAEIGNQLAKSKAQRRAQLWAKLKAHHVSSLRIVSAIRRAHVEKDLKNSFATDMYEQYKKTHSH
jgi:Ca2+-transporting ATPase